MESSAAPIDPAPMDILSDIMQDMDNLHPPKEKSSMEVEEVLALY